MELWKNGTLEKQKFGKIEIRKNGNWTLGKMVFWENGCWEKWKFGRTEI